MTHNGKPIRACCHSIFIRVTLAFIQHGVQYKHVRFVQYLDYVSLFFVQTSLSLIVYVLCTSLNHSDSFNLCRNYFPFYVFISFCCVVNMHPSETVFISQRHTFPVCIAGWPTQHLLDGILHGTRGHGHVLKFNYTASPAWKTWPASFFKSSFVHSSTENKNW